MVFLLETVRFKALTRYRLTPDDLGTIPRRYAVILVFGMAEEHGAVAGGLGRKARGFPRGRGLIERHLQVPRPAGTEPERPLWVPLWVRFPRCHL